MKWQKKQSKFNSEKKNPFQRMYVLGARVRAGVKAKEKYVFYISLHSTVCCLLDYQIELSSNLIAASKQRSNICKYTQRPWQTDFNIF